VVATMSKTYDGGYPYFPKWNVQHATVKTINSL